MCKFRYCNIYFLCYYSRVGLKERLGDGIEKAKEIAPFSDLGKKLVQVQHEAPKEIKEWARKELEKEKKKFHTPQIPQKEIELFSTEEASLSEFPSLYLKQDKNNAEKNSPQD